MDFSLLRTVVVLAQTRRCTRLVSGWPPEALCFWKIDTSDCNWCHKFSSFIFQHYCCWIQQSNSGLSNHISGWLLWPPGDSQRPPVLLNGQNNPNISWLEADSWRPLHDRVLKCVMGEQKMCVQAFKTFLPPTLFFSGWTQRQRGDRTETSVHSSSFQPPDAAMKAFFNKTSIKTQKNRWEYRATTLNLISN